MSSHHLSHRPENEDLREQAQMEEAVRLEDASNAPNFNGVKMHRKRGERRLIIACDGTWTNSNSDAPTQTGIKSLFPGIFSQTNVTLPSNITRLCRALNKSRVTAEGIDPGPPQVVFYHRGIGTDGGLEDKLIGGATGVSISEHIRECYGFICNNWREGDEIFLFGFSRGAYTARAISTLITDVGLLTIKGMEYFFQIFEDWKDQNMPDLLKAQQEAERKNGASGAFKGLKATPPMPSKAYTDELMKRGYTRPSVPIKVVGVFDTVGALGIPPMFGLHISSTELLQYSFVNTKVSQVVENAFQALALDDHRAAFAPAVWEEPNPPAILRTLNQVWFPGVHCNIGGAGGYDDQSLANDTLAWMITQLQGPDDDGTPLLDFDAEYLRWIFELNVDHCNATGGYRGWALGKMEETLSAVYSFAGDVKPWEGWDNWKDWAHPGDLARTPGRYESCSAKGGRKCGAAHVVTGSREKVYPSARVRVARGGRGLDDKVAYFPKGLEGFRLVGDGDRRDPLAGGFAWVGKDEKTGRQVVLEEEGMGMVERVLLVASARAVAARAEGGGAGGAGGAGGPGVDLDTEDGAPVKIGQPQRKTTVKLKVGRSIRRVAKKLGFDGVKAESG